MSNNAVVYRIKIVQQQIHIFKSSDDIISNVSCFKSCLIMARHGVQLDLFYVTVNGKSVLFYKS